MENVLPSSPPSPSPPSTLPAYSNALTTPRFSINEQSSVYTVPQLIITPCNNLQSPYACPIEQANQPFNSYPPTIVPNGCEFGVIGSSVYAGLWQERGFLDPQRTKLARIKRKLARQRTLSLSKNSSSSSSLCSNSSSSCSSSSSYSSYPNSNSNFPGGSNEVSSRRSFMCKRHTELQHRNGVAKGDHNLYQFCTSDNKKLRVLLEKELKNSDVGSLGRIVLPKREAEGNLPVLSDKEGIQLVMNDAETNIAWAFKYKFWSNNKSRMYVLENTGDFVKQNGLEMGDSFTIYEDESKKLYFSIKKAEKQTPTRSNVDTQHNTHPFDYTPRDEDEASLALLIEQLNHKEQHDASSLMMMMSFPGISGDHPMTSSSSSHRQQPCDIPSRTAASDELMPAASSYDDQEVMMMGFDDCYDGLGMLPNGHSYNFSF